MMKIAALENNILAIVAGTFAATIAAEDIEAQFHALTHFPDRRTKAELSELAERLNQFAAYVAELWDKACAPIPEPEIEAFARRHVPSAIHLPHRQISPEVVARWPADTLFVVYCAGPHCNGADQAALTLARLGRRVKVMIGGLTGWADEGFAFAGAA